MAEATGRPVLYVSGEESARQIKMRADRLSIRNENLFVVTETHLETILRHAERVQPVAMIVDSVQTVYSEELTSAAGSISQVRQAASRFQWWAKAEGVAVFLVGHVTKQGAIAGPKVLEYNCRFGDPETQVILPMLKSDLAQVMLNAIDGTLDKISLKWDEKFCLSVVLASGGYPGKYEKGKIISGLDKVSMRKDIVVFHAGTRRREGATEGFVTSGGRVLNVSGMGNTLEDARSSVYEAVGEIHFSNMYYRHDIGEKAV